MNPNAKLVKAVKQIGQDEDAEEDEESNQPAAHLWPLFSSSSLKKSILHFRKKMENIKGVKHIKSC